MECLTHGRHTIIRPWDVCLNKSFFYYWFSRIYYLIFLLLFSVYNNWCMMVKNHLYKLPIKIQNLSVNRPHTIMPKIECSLQCHYLYNIYDSANDDHHQHCIAIIIINVFKHQLPSFQIFVCIFTNTFVIRRVVIWNHFFWCGCFVVGISNFILVDG